VDKLFRRIIRESKRIESVSVSYSGNGNGNS